MTTEPTTAEQPRPEPIPPSGPSPIPATAAPYGIAPVAAAIPARPRRSRRRRLVDAAVVSSALATLPVAAAWNRVEATPEAGTLVDAVSELEAAEDQLSVRAAAAALHARAPGAPAAQPASARAAQPVRAPAAVAGPATVLAAPVPATTDVRGIGATPVDATTDIEAEPESPLVEAAAAATATAPTPIARAAGVELVVPSAAAVLVGFHEAAGPGTETMKSVAPLAVELNSKETALADDLVEDQVAPVMELPTRERAQPAASAVDVAVPAWEDIVAPVSGRVTAVDAYTLYGRYEDHRIEIEPEGHPGVRVVMIHIGGVEVEPGDDVVAGETVVARTAKQFPFASQIDRFAEEVSGVARPHVHMEVFRVG